MICIVDPQNIYINFNILEFLAVTHELRTLTAHFVFFSVFLGIYPLAYSAVCALVTIGFAQLFGGSKSSSESFIAYHAFFDFAVAQIL